MIFVYCGDNQESSRIAFINHKEKLLDNNVECLSIDKNNIQNINSIVDGSASLFHNERALFGENILSIKANRDLIKSCNDECHLEIILWEGMVEDRFVKNYFKNARIVAHKLPANIWNFLDSIYPGNLRQCQKLLEEISETLDGRMILYMIQRRTKDLILVENNLPGNRKLAHWQEAKLRQVSVRWDKGLLNNFYNKLTELEFANKNGELPYNINDAISVLFNYYLN